MRIHLILAEINTKYLIQSGLIPDIWKDVPELIQSVPKGSSPAVHGLNMESYIYNALKSEPHKGGLGCNKVVEQLNKLSKGWIPQKQVHNGTLEGHIDIYTSEYCVEIKTTSDWKKMRPWAIAQVCAYSAITNIKNIIVALPLSGVIFNYDLNKSTKKWSWNPVKYLEFLENAANIIMGKPLIYNGLGYHISKDEIMTETITDNSLQVFLGNPRSGKVELSDAELSKFIDIGSKCRLYVHAPYVLLISNSAKWSDIMVSNLRKYLETCIQIESRGLVIHIGCGGLDHLKKMISLIDDLPTKKTPLILETSVGEKNEILYHPEELLEFYLTLDRERYKICLDTCHCFGAGFSPLKVLDLFETASHGSVPIIHFNNSGRELGSRVDRHAIVGFISCKEMIEIKNYADKHNIDLIVE